MDNLHSAYGFDGLDKNGKLYGYDEENGVEYSLEKIGEIEYLKVNNGDEYEIVDNECVFSQNGEVIDALRVERKLTGVGMNFIFYTI